MGNRRFACKSIAFYYYGIDHLSLNLRHFMQQEVEKNRIVLTFPGDALLRNAFDSSTALTTLHNAEMVREIDTVYNAFPKGTSSPDLMEELQKLMIQPFPKGEQEDRGVTWFIDVKEMIKRSSKADYLRWMKELIKRQWELPCSVVHLYDFEDFLGSQQFIDEEIIGNALVNIPYVAYQLKIRKNRCYSKKEV